MIVSKVRRTVSSPVQLCVAQIFIISIASAAIMDLNHIKLVENNDSRLVATSNYNYAVMSPELLPKNWRTVSVNGEKVLIVTPTNEVITKTRSELIESELSFIESLRDRIAAGGSQGYGYVSSMSGGPSSPGGTMSIMTGSGSSSSFSSTSSSSSIQQSTSGGLSYNMRDDNNFSVSKSNLPYNWSTVIVNGDLISFVYRDGEVEMRPIASLESDRLDAVNQLKRELKDMQQTQERQVSDTMQHSMDMVSNVFNNILGQFPKPPSYRSAVGNMFGDNFPFGPNNSPFSAASGWPFGGGGAGAFAFANRR